MEDFYRHSDYRNVILEELTTRTRRNPRYSQSAFARDLGIASNRLCEILGGKQGLSRRSAKEVADRLDLGAMEQEFFCDLVDSEHARSSAQRRNAQQRILTKQKVLFAKREGASGDALGIIKVLPAKLIMSWYHLTIVELVRISRRLESADWYSKKLDISATAVKLALQELLSHDLITYDPSSGNYSASHNVSTVDIPAKEIKAFHEQMTALAVKALYSSSVQDREFNSVILPMRMEEFGKFKLRLRALVNDFADAADAEKNPDLICGLSTQMFQIAALDLEKT